MEKNSLSLDEPVPTSDKREEAEDINSSDDDEEETDENEDDDDILDDDEHVEDMEKMNFDFEAFPPAEEDVEDIAGLLTQIFLRADVNCKELAAAIVAQSPMGCVYKPAEEDLDAEEDDTIVYGVLSIVRLNGREHFQSSVTECLLNRAKKFATSEVNKLFEKYLTANEQCEEKVGLLINERLLHFPTQIAGPAFASFSQEYNAMPKKERFQRIVAILKIRISQDDPKNASNSGDQQNAKGKSKRKMGKAEKKRQMAVQMATADIIYDNPEEKLLFMQDETSQSVPFFQYPVESEVDKASKFHSIRRAGRIYRPYRRVCLLTPKQFLHFADTVAKSDL